jgi:hypothetical protein
MGGAVNSNHSVLFLDFPHIFYGKALLTVNGYKCFAKKGEKTDMNYMRKVFYLKEYRGNTEGKNAGYAKICQREDALKIEICLSGNLSFQGEKLYLLIQNQDVVNRLYFATLSYGESVINRTRSVREIGLETGEIIGILIGAKGSILCAGTEDDSLDVTNFMGQEKKAERLETSEAERTEQGVSEKAAMGDPEEAEPDDLEKLETNETELNYHKIFASHAGMYPFEDDEMELCVQITPADFSDFPQEFWQMTSNSFLLQGYYNYRHLIFAKADKKLYLGIPGQYHRRDKYLAELFGFGRFKGIHSKKEKLGDFGYWMKEILT